MALQIRRGLQANLPANPAEGELLYATDSGNLYIGVSGSPQLISFSGSGGGGNSNVQAISDLSDVASISGITDGQALLWNAANSRFEHGTVASSYGDADVLTLSEGNWAGNIIPSADVTYDLGSATYRWKDLYLSGNTITLGSATISADGANLVIGAQTVATENFVNAEINALIGGAPGTLDTLAEIANALNSSNAQLSAVAFSGEYSDVLNRPAMSLVGNDLSYDGTTIDLSTVVGVQGNVGPQGTAGNDGVSISNVDATSGNLIVTLSDSSTIDAGNVQGPQGLQGIQGPQGIQGDGNAGISSATVTGTNLVLTLADGSTVNAGNVVGPQGAAGNDGADGVGIISTSIVGGSLILNYSNTSTQNVGNIQGPQGDQGIQGPQGNVGLTGPQGPQGNVGPQGPAGVDVSSASVNGSGNLIITLSDASTVDAGNVRGADGAVDQTLSLAGNVITISGSNSNVDLTTILGAYHTVNTDAQTLNLSGNTLTISGSGSSVDLSSFAGGGSSTFGIAGNTGTHTFDGSTETLTFLGTTNEINVAVATNFLSLELANTAVTAGTYGDAGNVAQFTVDAKGRITGVTEIAISGGGGGIADLSGNVLSDLGDVSSTAPTSGQVLKWNGSSWAPAADSTGSGGGGSGAVMERFKLNYASNGALSTVSDLTSGINTVTINSTTGGEVTIEFSSYNYPPGSIIFYGYDYTNNTYAIVPMETSMGFREIPAGGTSGSPTLFDGTNTLEVKLRLREAETGASRGGFGTTTHAWIQFLMYD